MKAKTERTYSLALIISVWTALVIAGSMALYAVEQYMSIPGVTARSLFLDHLWHVVSLGVLIFIFCHILLRRILVQPLLKIYLHLYEARKMRVHPLRLRTHIAELRSIIDGINLLLPAPRRKHDFPYLQQHLLDIRRLVARIPPSAQSQSMAILSRLADLENDLAAASAFSPDAIAELGDPLNAGPATFEPMK